MSRYGVRLGTQGETLLVVMIMIIGMRVIVICNVYKERGECMGSPKEEISSQVLINAAVGWFLVFNIHMLITHIPRK